MALRRNHRARIVTTFVWPKMEIVHTINIFLQKRKAVLCTLAISSSSCWLETTFGSLGIFCFLGWKKYRFDHPTVSCFNHRTLSWFNAYLIAQIMKIAAFLPQLVIHTRDEAVLRIRLEFPISPTFEEGFQFVLNFWVGAAQEFSTDKNNGRLNLKGILA